LVTHHEAFPTCAPLFRELRQVEVSADLCSYLLGEVGLEGKAESSDSPDISHFESADDEELRDTGVLKHLTLVEHTCVARGKTAHEQRLPMWMRRQPRLFRVRSPEALARTMLGDKAMARDDLDPSELLGPIPNGDSEERMLRELQLPAIKPDDGMLTLTVNGKTVIDGAPSSAHSDGSSVLGLPFGDQPSDGDVYGRIGARRLSLQSHQSIQSVESDVVSDLAPSDLGRVGARRLTHQSIHSVESDFSVGSSTLLFGGRTASRHTTAVSHVEAFSPVPTGRKPSFLTAGSSNPFSGSGGVRRPSSISEISDTWPQDQQGERFGGPGTLPLLKKIDFKEHKKMQTQRVNRLFESVLATEEKGGPMNLEKPFGGLRLEPKSAGAPPSLSPASDDKVPVLGLSLSPASDDKVPALSPAEHSPRGAPEPNPAPAEHQRAGGAVQQPVAATPKRSSFFSGLRFRSSLFGRRQQASKDTSQAAGDVEKAAR
jgi:hypothetical protein